MIGAEGNPFYIEELVKMLVEDGVIITGEEQWQIEPERLAEVDVPDTLTGVLQARLEGLPQEERINSNKLPWLVTSSGMTRSTISEMNQYQRIRNPNYALRNLTYLPYVPAN